MNLLIKQHYPFALFITFVALLRVWLAPHVGLGVDEAHYVLYGLHLDWSYFDHPPLVGWTQAVCTSIFGVNELGARVGAIFIGYLTSILLYILLYSLEKDAKKSFIALLALYGSFLFNALFLMLMPDTFLFLFIIPIIFAVIKLQNTNSILWWAVLGALLGLSGLAKYTAVLFIFPIILYVFLKRRWDLIFTKKIFIPIGIALLFISPVLYWNIVHHWISFSYQSNHVVGDNHINWSGFASSIGAQVGAYNPFLFPLAFYGLYKTLRSKNDTLILSGLFGAVLIGFFTYASLYNTALPHWSALFYLLFIPLGTYFILAKSYPRYLKFAIGFGLILSSVAYAELGLKFIPQPNYQSLHRDIYGWPQIMQEANDYAKENNISNLAVINWTLASRAIFYDRPYKSEIFLLDNRYDQFDLWQKDSPLGKDLVIIDTHFFHKDLVNYLKCDSLDNNKSFDILLHGNKVNTINLLTCKHYQGLK